MKESQLRAIYETACAGKGFEPNDSQFKVWKQTLGWIDERDLSQALVNWFTDNQGFPMPADLKPLAMRVRLGRDSQSSEKLDAAYWECRTCGKGMRGYVPPSDHEPRICTSPYTPLNRADGIPRSLPRNEICGSIMEEVERRPQYQGTGI